MATTCRPSTTTRTALRRPVDRPRVPHRRALSTPRAADGRGPSIFDLVDAQMADVERQFQELDRVAAEAARAAESSSDGWRTLPGGGRSWRRDSRSESANGGGVYRREWRSESVTVWGAAPPAPAPATPLSPGLLTAPAVAAALALGAYAAVAAAFVRRVGATRYAAARAWPLAVAWPLLALASPDFRGQLRAALKADAATRGGLGQGGGVPAAPRADGDQAPPPPPAA